MGGALKVFIVMVSIPLVYSGLMLVADSALALWGALFVAGLLGIMWFHRARRRPVYLPYIIFWVILVGAMWYAGSSGWCPGGTAAKSMRLPGIFCPFAKK